MLLAFLRAIYPVQPDLFVLAVVENGDGIAIDYGNDFGWPGEAGGRHGEQKEEKDGAETTHAGLH